MDTSVLWENTPLVQFNSNETTSGIRDPSGVFSIQWLTSEDIIVDAISLVFTVV